MAAKTWLLIMCLGGGAECADDGNMTTTYVTKRQCAAAVISAPEGSLAQCISPTGAVVRQRGERPIRYRIDDDDREDRGLIYETERELRGIVREIWR